MPPPKLSASVLDAVFAKQMRDYLDFRAVNANEPDCRPSLRDMIENHPDAGRSKKNLCSLCDIHEDSWRKYMLNRFGPPFGLIEKLMRITGCYKPLYRLASRCGFTLIRRVELSSVPARRVCDLLSLQQSFLDFQSLYLSVGFAANQGKQRELANLALDIQEHLEAFKQALSITSR